MKMAKCGELKSKKRQRQTALAQKRRCGETALAKSALAETQPQ
jgi:hypothetical protein